jgi:hypothetical protein
VPGDRPGDPVGEHPPGPLESRERRFGRRTECPVDPARAESRLGQPPLQQLDVGPVGAAAENGYQGRSPRSEEHARVYTLADYLDDKCWRSW